MENRKTKTKILNENEMEQAVGGFEYTGCLEWLRGYNIACPTCGKDDTGTVTRRYATALHAYYTCGKCGQNFYYTLGLNKKVKVCKE